MEELESKIVELLNKAETDLDVKEFNMLSESIIDYIDEIGRRKKE